MNHAPASPPTNHQSPASESTVSPQEPLRGLPKGGLRRFLLLWTGGALLSLLLVSGGFAYAVAKLHHQTNQIFLAGKSLQTNHRFEAALLTEGREDLLNLPTYTASTDTARQEEQQKLLKESDALLQELRSQADTTDDQAIVTRVAADYGIFRATVFTTRERAKTQAALDQLLESLHEHRVLNELQMEQTMQASTALNRLVDRLAVGLILIATLLFGAGAFELWKRLFTPGLRLARTVEAFGEGDFTARAPVLRPDEMGNLAETFNTMAEAIEQRERERLDFVATVAHDLKNPLVVIGGAAHLLKDKDSRMDADQRTQWLTAIESSARNLEDIISDLTDSVQAETGRIALDARPMDLASLVSTVVQTYAPSHPHHAITYAGPASCPLEGDSKRLVRVVTNLVSNAVKYSPQGGDIEVCLQDGIQEDGRTFALLTVRDCGVGIAEEDIPKLFRPFARLDRTRHLAKGTGLGLSSVRKIIELHGGKIELESKLGEGTCVFIRLPLKNAGLHPEQGPSE